MSQQDMLKTPQTCVELAKKKGAQEASARTYRVRDIEMQWRDGKLTRPVKDVNIIGNGPKVLELVDMVGNDLEIDEGGWTCGKDGQGVPVSQGLPTVRVWSITVGGSTRKG